MYGLNFDMYQTTAIAVVMLFVGNSLRKKISPLEKLCIPAPVVGGLVFAIISCALYSAGVVEFSFDETLRTVFMVAFFTSVGFKVSAKVLKSGGTDLIILVSCVAVLIVGQNFLAIGLSQVLNLTSPLIGLCTGSISMAGGHGTAGAFGPVLEDLGFHEATTFCTAAATFGLVAGSLVGGPVGRRLILKNDLLKTVVKADETPLIEEEKNNHRSFKTYAPASYQLAIAMGLGTAVSALLSKIGMTFPIYIGAMIVAALMRNYSELTGQFTIHVEEINDIGEICLSLFLGIAMITLKLWQLAELALPMLILLFGQIIFMLVFAYVVVYNALGRNYDAAIFSAGICGFGLGATPNAMANMQVLTNKFAPSIKAYSLVPIVGGMFMDFLNSMAITFFINFL